jgi:DNA-binding response OmpR family regulator
MPGMSGNELAERMRTVRGNIRVVFMSAYSVEAVETHGVLRPGAAFLQKPFTIPELTGLLRAALDRDGS